MQALQGALCHKVLGEEEGSFEEPWGGTGGKDILKRAGRESTNQELLASPLKSELNSA